MSITGRQWGHSYAAPVLRKADSDGTENLSPEGAFTRCLSSPPGALPPFHPRSFSALRYTYIEWNSRGWISSLYHSNIFPFFPGRKKKETPSRPSPPCLTYDRVDRNGYAAGYYRRNIQEAASICRARPRRVIYKFRLRLRAGLCNKNSGTRPSPVHPEIV